MRIPILLVVLCSLVFGSLTRADGEAGYAPAKVVYDLSSPDPEVLSHLLDRVSLLQNLYGNDPLEASIIVIAHEGAIPLLSNRNTSAHSELLHRAASLSMGEVIAFQVCRTSARMQGFGEREFPAFVSLVPMADAELVKLQQAGYAYLR